MRELIPWNESVYQDYGFESNPYDSFKLITKKESGHWEEDKEEPKSTQTRVSQCI
jgi:hypothetical protein